MQHPMEINNDIIDTYQQRVAAIRKLSDREIIGAYDDQIADLREELLYSHPSFFCGQHTRQEILESLSLCLTFFLLQKVPFQAFLAHF